VLSDAPIADWPDWLLRLAHPSKGPWQGNAEGVDDIPHGGVPTHGPSDCTDRASFKPTLNLRARCKVILRKVENAEVGRRNELLNWASYRLGQVCAEGKLNPDIAALLLEGASKECGLWHDDGPQQCLATIKSGIGAGIRDASERLAKVIPFKMRKS
jgi:hypothetical protein